jgi:uncharacterized protein (TIGR02145 family)
MRIFRLFIWLVITVFLGLSAGCIKKDHRDKYTGTWTFRITREINRTGMPGGLGYSSTTNYNEGAIVYGKGRDDLMIFLNAGMLVNFTLSTSGAITNLPGDHSFGNFEGTGVINLSYGHHGNYVDMTYIYGRKGSFSSEQPSASTDFSRPFTSGAFLNGIVNAHCSVTNVAFEYGTGTDYGNVTTANLIVNGFDDVSVGADVTGLIPNTSYHFRVKAENSNSIIYGKDMVFTTLNVTDPVSDIDGNTYRTVKIDKMLWMAENLKVTRLNNGAPLINIADNISFSGPGYCFYNNDSSLKNEYGALYNYTAVATGMLCPAGWHVPTDGEWTALEEYTGGTGKTGGSLKEAGTPHWLPPNTNAIDLAGFTALPGGMRRMMGEFTGLHQIAIFRSTAEQGNGAQGNGWNIFGTSFYLLDWEREYSLSVRCVKD